MWLRAEDLRGISQCKVRIGRWVFVRNCSLKADSTFRESEHRCLPADRRLLDLPSLAAAAVQREGVGSWSDAILYSGERLMHAHSLSAIVAVAKHCSQHNQLLDKAAIAVLKNWIILKRLQAAIAPSEKNALHTENVIFDTRTMNILHQFCS